MKLFPYHDASGKLFPEIDTRQVSVELFAQYLELSRFTVWDRATRGEFGRTPAEGAWVVPSRSGKRGQWAFRPAVIFRRKNWGRFAQLGFNPVELESRVRIYHCDPNKTAEREQQRDATVLPPEWQSVLRSLSAANMEALALVRRFAPVPMHDEQVNTVVKA